jgi:uncharacterized protein YbjT (DUF2867 family)
MTLKYLITGATGGLGREVLNYFVANIPRSEFAAASSNPENNPTFENRGIAFRHVNYDDSQSLETGLRDVENLLFVSASGMRRGEQHARVIQAAKKAGVNHVRSIYGRVGLLDNVADEVNYLPRSGIHLWPSEGFRIHPRLL